MPIRRDSIERARYSESLGAPAPLLAFELGHGDQIRTTAQRDNDLLFGDEPQRDRSTVLVLEHARAAERM